MIGKQILIDIGVVIIAPLVLVVGYYYFFPPELVVDSSGAEPLRVSAEDKPGGKARMALAQLRSTNIDVEFFRDPAFIALKEHSVTIPSSALGRANPFIIPEELLVKEKNSKPGHLEPVKVAAPPPPPPPPVVLVKPTFRR